MSTKETQVLLVEDGRVDERIIRAALSKCERPKMSVAHTRSLGDAIEYCKNQKPDLVLLDLGLTDSSGIVTLEKFRAQITSVPVIVLTSTDDEEIATQALHNGAQDYLIKIEVDSKILQRAIRYSVERSRTEELMRRDQSQLQEAQKQQSVWQLTAGIAHEINTPMQYISNNTRFFEETFSKALLLLELYAAIFKSLPANPEVVDAQKRITAAMTRLDMEYLLQDTPSAIAQTLEGISHVQKILSAMKVFSHPGTTVMRPVDLKKGLESSIQLACHEWKKVAQVALDCPNDIPTVMGIPNEIHQVFLNLIVNAAHAIGDAQKNEPDRQGKIEIRVRPFAEHVEIIIGDNGTGIPEEVRPRIFDPFFTTKELGKGTGQGLAIAQSVVVQKHKGSLSFETTMGKGTNFIIRLPRVQEAEIAAPVLN